MIELIKTTAITILIEAIRNEIEHGKQNIENTIENQKTTTYWNIGKHISQHLLDYSDRAEYGDNLFELIAAELNIGASTLYSVGLRPTTQYKKSIFLLTSKNYLKVKA